VTNPLRLAQLNGTVEHMTKRTPDIHDSVRVTAEHLKEAGLETSPSSVWRVQKSVRGRQPGFSRGRDGKLRPDRQSDTTRRDAEIYHMHTDNMSMREIAAKVGCSVGTVHRIIKKFEDQEGK
jgi:Mor family transcriptional regulator